MLGYKFLEATPVYSGKVLTQASDAIRLYPKGWFRVNG